MLPQSFGAFRLALNFSAPPGTEPNLRNSPLNRRTKECLFSPLSRILVRALPDPSSAENNIPRIKHRGLSWGNRALRHIELHPGGSGIDRLDGGRRGLVAVTDLHRRAYRRFENGERNPIDISYFAGLRTQLHIIADDNAVGCVVKFDDVEGSSRGDA